jgi:hypothetical protein
VTRLANRLGLQPCRRPEDVLGVKHRWLGYRRPPPAELLRAANYAVLRR